MEVALVNNKQIYQSYSNKSTSITYEFVSAPITAGNDSDSDFAKKHVENLKTAVEKIKSPNKWTISLTFSIIEEKAVDILNINLSGLLIEYLHRLTEGNAYYSFKMPVTYYKTFFKTPAEEVVVSIKTEVNNGITVAKFSRVIDSTDHAKSLPSINENITIYMIADSDWFADFGSSLETTRIFSKMLNESILTDFHLVAANGEEVSCHKAVLAAHSEGLAAMIQSGMQESINSKIELKRVGSGKDGIPISEGGVHAFLEFLYCRRLSSAVRSSCVALELLELGHQYGIPSMELAMKAVILEKEIKRVDVDVALQIFFYTRSREGHEDLIKKVVQVLKLKFEELQQLDLYKELYPDQTPRQLFECALLWTN